MNQAFLLLILVPKQFQTRTQLFWDFSSNTKDALTCAAGLELAGAFLFVFLSLCIFVFSYLRLLYFLYSHLRLPWGAQLVWNWLVPPAGTFLAAPASRGAPHPWQRPGGEHKLCREMYIQIYTCTKSRQIQTYTMCITHVLKVNNAGCPRDS